MALVVTPPRRLSGTITVPGDKSISHRAALVGACAVGDTVIENFLLGADCLATVRCLKALGVKITGDNGTLTVHGRGLAAWREPDGVLDCGNSGTTMRLLLGLLAACPFFAVLTGDRSLRRRPMDRVAGPLRAMGASVWGRGEGSRAPLAVRGGSLRGIDYRLPVASAQVKSALLLAGLFAQGPTVVREPVPTRDHTERMLRFFGIPVEVGGNAVTVPGGAPPLQGRFLRVPGDISAAAFFLVAASIVPDSEVTIRDVGLNPLRTGVVDVLRAMGGDVRVIPKGEWNGEPVGDITVRAAELRGTVIEGSLVPRAVDEIPVLAVAAAVARGKTVIRDAAELKVKESDRLAAMARELRRLGARVEELPDGLEIAGGRPLVGAVCHGHGDHRVAMALAVAGLVARGTTVVRGARAIGVSFPGFGGILHSLRVE